MSKYDNDLLVAAKINRVVINSDFELTLYSDDHFFVITAENSRKGFGPVFNVAAFETRTPKLSLVDNGRAKPRQKATVLNIADYRKSPTSV